MRMAFAVVFTVLAGASISPSHADPYRWCADYGAGTDGGGTNCYFSTLEQCRATVSGIGGYCRVNGFYDGRAVTTPGDGVTRSRSRASR